MIDVSKWTWPGATKLFSKESGVSSHYLKKQHVRLWRMVMLPFKQRHLDLQFQGIYHIAALNFWIQVSQLISEVILRFGKYNPFNFHDGKLVFFFKSSWNTSTEKENNTTNQYMSGKFWRCRSLIQTWSICSAFPIQRAVFRYLDGAWYISALFFSRMFLQIFPKDRYFEDYWWAGQQSLWTLGRKQFLGGVLGNDPNWLRNQLGRNHHVDFGWGELSGFCWEKGVERLRQVIDWRNQQKSQHDMIRLLLSGKVATVQPQSNHKFWGAPGIRIWLWDRKI